MEIKINKVNTKMNERKIQFMEENGGINSHPDTTHRHYVSIDRI